jgi:hypothetical protein
MNDSNKRPIALSILGYILIIGGVLFVLKIAFKGSFSAERNIVNLILKGMSIIVGIGYLKMRKWAFYLWIFGYITGIILLFVWPPSEEVLRIYTSGKSIIIMLIVPTIVVILTLNYWGKLK